MESKWIAFKDQKPEYQRNLFIALWEPCLSERGHGYVYVAEVTGMQEMRVTGWEGDISIQEIMSGLTHWRPIDVPGAGPKGEAVK